ncbi:hypothetical protein IWW36_002435 [Coemansia brasiliensis]|uniref:Needs CLA4 to survive protein 3 n=1 Tax=Coemansia brasiliensis TaxID=2650707 RepID=A0A9W8I9P2_9FUNG|nr:hypothetical protein IWW36_002435 [Coemansia brasiliensis]
MTEGTKTMDRSDRIRQLKARLERLHAEELEIEAELCALEAETTMEPADQLSRNEIQRFSRQLVMEEIGVEGQLQLRNSKVLVVGTGGLGSPCAMYLAAMGVGTLGLVDHDTVDHSNLHRQIIHTAGACGSSKVISARMTLRRLNPQCNVRIHDQLLDSSNALQIMRGYDIVIDATDNAATRYLVNDACVMLGLPLVSGSAVRLEGQLTVLNYAGGPCYRCLFPVPPPPDTVATCSDAGVLGVVPGVIGCLQAMETVKVLTGRKSMDSPMLLLFSYKAAQPFRSVRLRSRMASCAVCGDAPSITRLIDYVAFCGSGPNDKTPDLHILDPAQRVTCRELSTVLNESQRCLVLDVRDEAQFAICRLPGAVNVPLEHFDRRRADLEQMLDELNGAPVYAVCRRGNLSQLAVKHIRDELGYPTCFDVARGLLGWQAEVDSEFPAY